MFKLLSMAHYIYTSCKIHVHEFVKFDNQLSHRTDNFIRLEKHVIFRSLAKLTTTKLKNTASTWWTME